MNQISCPSCNAVNMVDATFCDSCGKSLLKKCRFCNTANLVSASFCKGCGIKLSAAVFGISQKSIQQFVEFCHQFPGYMDDLSKYKSFMEKSIKEADERREIINHLNEYREFSEQNIQQFWGYFLIVDSPWQISKVIIDNRQEIKNGYIKLSNYHCSVHDVVKKEYFALFHERINNVTRHDKVLRVSYSDGHTMDLYPRVLGANINSIVLGGLGFLLNLATEDSTSDYQKSVQDREARDRSQARTSEAEWKEAYIQGWFNFLRNILKEKNER